MNKEECVRKIYERHKYRMSLNRPFRDDLDGLYCPKIVTLPSGRKIPFDRISICYINEFSDLIGHDKFVISGEEWKDCVYYAVAHALDFDKTCHDQINIDSILKEIDQHLLFLEDVDKKFEFPFPCDLFYGVNEFSFIIGPVRFEAREVWLERKFTEGFISENVRRRILLHWSGNTSVEYSTPSLDNDREEAILKITEESSFVCSVTTNGISPKFARIRAKTAANLALASVALWSENPSMTLDAMNLVDDRAFRILHEITFGGKYGFSYTARKSHFPGGVRLRNGEWDSITKNYSDHFNVIGDIFKYILDANYNNQRQNIIHSLAHAILWFNKAFREKEDVFSIVHSASALDCLASGCGRDGIKKLINNRLNIAKNSTIWKSGTQTVDEAVDEIYDRARTAMLHGRRYDNKKIESRPFHDWYLVRRRAENLTADCLLACIGLSAMNMDNDDPTAWIGL